jgi:hypothetical protein
LLIVHDTDGGDATLTITGGYNAAGDTSIQLVSAGDSVTLESVDVNGTCYWRVVRANGVAINSDSCGTAGAAYGTGVTATEYGDEIIHKTVLTFAAHNTAMTDGVGVVGYGGTKVYDFPAGAIQILGSVVNLTATSTNDTGINSLFNGDCSLGTATAGNSNTLTSTEADILNSFATNTAVAGAAAVKGQGSQMAAAILNGVATAADCYLNYLVDDGCQDITNGAAGLLSTGTVTIHWINLGDN